MEIREVFSMDQLYPLLLRRIEELEQLVLLKQKALAKTVPGRLRITRSNGRFQCHRVEDDSRDVFLPREKIGEARTLAQKSYDKEVLDEASRLLLVAKRFLKNYNPDSIVDIYENMHLVRQKLVTPVRLSDDDYVKRWLAVKYAGRRFDDSAELYTSLNVRVRSKSEVIIADALTRYGVPYRYEFPYRMQVAKVSSNRADNGGRQVASESRKRLQTVCPDFTCLNVRTRREFIWEHFGLIDNVDYAKNMVAKMEMYAENGYFEGVNLVTTYETEDQRISSPMVSRLIENVLLR